MLAYLEKPKLIGGFMRTDDQGLDIADIAIPKGNGKS